MVSRYNNGVYLSDNILTPLIHYNVMKTYLPTIFVNGWSSQWEACFNFLGRTAQHGFLLFAWNLWSRHGIPLGPMLSDEEGTSKIKLRNLRCKTINMSQRLPVYIHAEVSYTFMFARMPVNILAHNAKALGRSVTFSKYEFEENEEDTGKNDTCNWI